MKIQLTTTKEVVTEVEMQIPYYSKNAENNILYKVYGEDAWDVLEVYSKNDAHKIGFNNVRAAISNTIQCTKEEFDSSYEEVQKKLNDLKNK